jgi:hypothetical protein
MKEGPELFDFVIAVLQTFAVLYLVCGVYLATHKTGGSQESDEPARKISNPG